jgi:3'(2'), 5'-bisphosphate nucleotidase
MNMDLEKLSQKILEISSLASKAIMSIYDKEDINIVNKEDGSPVTEADLQSNSIIYQGLTDIELNIPILSEEQKTEVDLSIDTFWLVDPLDGTKEFINRNGEFTVNIALIHNKTPVLGLVQAPALNDIYLGISGGGAFKLKDGIKLPIITDQISKDLCRIIVSRSHQSLKETRFIRMAGRNFKKVELHRAGSSLKLCRVAEGSADIYPRLGPTFQWDIAAGQAVLESAGGNVIDLEGHQLDYLCDHTRKNPDFLAIGDVNKEWASTLRQ